MSKWEGNTATHWNRGKKTREQFKSSIQDYDKSNKKYAYRKLNERYPLFLFYYLVSFQNDKCFVCDKILDSTAVLSHDLSHDRKNPRLSRNIAQYEEYEEDLDPNDQQQPFEQKETEENIDLLNKFYEFSLIHKKCNTSVSQRKWLFEKEE